MDEYGWGLTSAGFRRPTYNELLDALEHKARELFGATANLTVRSPLGLFLRIFAWILNILFSVLEDVYNSRFVDTAVGTSLLNLGRAIGLRVLSAQKASGYIMVTGPAGGHSTGGMAGLKLRPASSSLLFRILKLVQRVRSWCRSAAQALARMVMWRRIRSPPSQTPAR